MDSLIRKWFSTWESGEIQDLPVTDSFTHTSPFGTIEGKSVYLSLVNKNKDKFLGYQFIIHDVIENDNSGCTRYTAKQDKTFGLEVSEWYYFKDGLIDRIIAYYHIGDIREERILEGI